METSENISKKVNMTKTIKDINLVNLINTLCDSIKEYYKVTQNVNRNESILINSFKKEIYNSDSIINTILKEGINDNKINLYNKTINKLSEDLKSLQLNVKSNEKNLSFFFEDAKILFKKIKEERQEFLLRIQKRVNSTSIGRESIYSLAKNINNHYYNSEIRKINNVFPKEIKNINNINVHSNINNLNLNRIQEKIEEENKSKKARSHSNQRKEIFVEINNENSYENNNNSSYKGFKQNQNKEIERLDKLNKRYEFYIKKLNIELKKYQSQSHNNNKYINLVPNNSKDKIIISLKENLKLNNMKYNKLMDNFNNSQNLLKKLKYENIKLRGGSLESNYRYTNNNNEPNKNIIAKLNYLIKENKILKNKLNNSDFNLHLNPTPKNSDSDTKNISLQKKIELFKKKISSTEKKLLDEQKKNKQLINENLLLKKQESEISKISKKNNEISKLLINKQNELTKLQKENIEKNKEFENYKKSTNERSQNNYGDNFNKIIENFNKEKNNLMTEKNTLQDKINYYKTQIKKIKNELYEKIQANIELQINYDKKISDMRDDFNKKIEELNTKNKNLENNLEECQNFNNELNQQINDLNQQIISKDIKILELNYQIEQIEKNASNKETENKKFSEESKDNKSNEKRNQRINLLKDNLEELRVKNKDLNEELNKTKKDNEILAEKILNYENLKKEENNKKQNDINEEIEKIKKENEDLRNKNERLTGEIKEILNNNKLNDTNTEILKSQSEELEGLKQLIFKFETERKKYNNENKALKKENEKIQAQLMRLSKSLPEEYNELLKEYKDLDIKYKSLLKNKLNSSKKEDSTQSLSGNNTKNIKNEENLKELNKAKKEIEIIKKKNMELVKQLEEKEINKDCYDNKSEQNVSNYEEEFDLKKMAKGAKDKNRSQDINIDYPGIQTIKERYRELDFYYNSLEELVKKLLLNINCNPKNKVYVSELCKIVGFDHETTNKILANKNKNFILGLFNK